MLSGILHVTLWVFSQKWKSPRRSGEGSLCGAEIPQSSPPTMAPESGLGFSGGQVPGAEMAVCGALRGRSETEKPVPGRRTTDAQARRSGRAGDREPPICGLWSTPSSTSRSAAVSGECCRRISRQSRQSGVTSNRPARHRPSHFVPVARRGSTRRRTSSLIGSWRILWSWWARGAGRRREQNSEEMSDCASPETVALYAGVQALRRGNR